MIKILEVALGNKKEAFIEKRLKDGVNIIYSDDNNRGKTILMQSILHTIGNTSVFPSMPKAFRYKEYYYYLKMEINKIVYEFLRYENCIYLITSSEARIFGSIKEFSKYFNDNIFELPYFITKDKQLLRTPLELFYLCFFVGSDTKNTSIIPSAAIKRFNKKDFESMLSNFNNYSDDIIKIYEELKEKTSKKKELQEKSKDLRNKINKINTYKQMNETYLPSISKEKYESIKKEIEKYNNNLTILKKEFYRLSNKKFKKINLLKEIHSIKLKVNVGFLFCEDCNSTNIIYSNSENGFKFDVSNDVIRNRIITSIHEELETIESELKELQNEINKTQLGLDNFLNKTENSQVTTNDLMFYFDEFHNYDKYFRESYDLTIELSKLNDEIEQIKNQIENIENRQKTDLKNIEKLLSEEYEKVDNEIEDKLNGLFTKNNETFSGAQATIFLYSRIMAITKYFGLKWPIIIDSYRDGEVSSKKELIILEELKKVNNQVILSSTLKNEEYKYNKYDTIEGINSINYSDVPEQTLLREEYVNEFMKLLEPFGILL